MNNVIARMSLVAIAAAMPLTSVGASEISISLRAVVEPHCKVVDVLPGTGDFSRSFEVMVSCNAPNYRLSVISGNDAVPFELSNTSGATGSVSTIGNSISVSPTQPGLHVFNLEIAENAPEGDSTLMIQLDGF